MLSIVDIAKQAGVSTATVSRYLDGARVRKADHIQSVIDATGFTRNAAASSLRRGQFNCIGLIVPDIANPLLAQIVTGVEETLKDFGIRVLLGNSDEDQERQIELLRDLSMRADGIILFPITEDPLSSPLNTDIPVVLVDRKGLPDRTCNFVAVDNHGGARQAVEHLLELGHTRIAIIAGPANTTPGRERLEGFMDTLTEAKITIPADYIYHGDFHRPSGEAAVAHLMSLPQPPTAIFSSNNSMTIGALYGCRALQLDIPREVSLIGFDDIDLAPLLNPPLTVVDRPTGLQGQVAAQQLLAQLNPPTDPAEQTQVETIYLPTNLIIRESTSVPLAERTKE